MSILLVPEGVDGDRIDAAAARMTGASRSRVVDLIAESKVLLDGVAVTKASTRVRSGQMLDIDLSDPAPRATVVPAFVADMRIVHDDADVVVVDKPAGVAAHPSLGWDGPSVVEHLAAAGFGISTNGAPERQGIVQRLDVGTSGLMVVAKSEHAYTVLKQAFRDRTPEKIYLALVQGLPDPVVGTIDAPIGRHRGHDWKRAVGTASPITRPLRPSGTPACNEFILRRDAPIRSGCTWQRCTIRAAVIRSTVPIRCSHADSGWIVSGCMPRNCRSPIRARGTG